VDKIKKLEAMAMRLLATARQTASQRNTGNNVIASKRIQPMSCSEAMKYLELKCIALLLCRSAAKAKRFAK
jgi:hypothetical protein